MTKQLAAVPWWPDPDSEDPHPAADCADLGERIAGGVNKYPTDQRTAVARKLKAIYTSTRALGLSHQAGINAAVGVLAGDRALSEDVADGPGPLPAEIEAMIGPLQGQQRQEVEMGFRARYAELRKKMNEAEARRFAANHAEEIATRLGLIAPHRDDTVLDPRLASQRLVEDVEARQLADPAKSYDQCLAEAKVAHPKWVAATAAGPRVLGLALTPPARTASAKLAEAVEARILADPNKPYDVALREVTKAHPELVDAVSGPGRHEDD